MKFDLKLLSACAFCSLASMRVTDAMLPALAQTFDASTARAAQVISVYALAYGLVQLAYGPVGDRFGKVRVIAWATLACTVGQVCAALAPSLEWLIVSRALTAAAAAGVVPLAMAWIGDTVPMDERQPVLARLLGATVFGMICGQWAGGLLTEWLGWRTAFCLLAAAFALCGSLLLRQQWHLAPVRVAPKPKAMRQILLTPWPRTVLILAALEGACAFSALAFVPLHLHTQFGLSLTLAGGLATTFGLGGLAYAALARRLVQRFDPAGLARLGAVMTCAAFGLMAVADVWWLAWMACLAAGSGFYTLHNVLQLNATQMAPAARGTAVALFACFLFFGQSLGTAAAAWGVDHLSTRAVFAAAAVGLLVVGLLLARLLRGH